MKIGQHLVKLWAIVGVLFFSDSRCSLRYLRDPQKALVVAKARPLSHLALKSPQAKTGCKTRWIWCKFYFKKSTRKRAFFTHAQRRNGRIDSNQNLHIDSWGRSNTAAKLAFKVSDVTTVINWNCMTGKWRTKMTTLSPPIDNIWATVVFWR